MHRVHILDNEKSVSGLGFGCASVLGRVGRRESLDALSCAFDHGINYFDIARSYGYGEAESLLGAFLKGRRDEAFVTTKFGIAPPRHQALLRYVKPLARMALSRLPAMRSRVSSGANAMSTRGNFGIPFAEQSLARSLRELKTDYVDCLLVHACTAADLSDELIEFLERKLDAGEIRAFGFSTVNTEIADFRQRLPKNTYVLQTGFSVFEPKQFAGEGDNFEPGRFVLHSVFGGGGALAQFSEWLQDAQAKPEISHLIAAGGLDIQDKAAIAAYSLAYALWKNFRGVVLHSSFNTEHIIANSRIAAKIPYTPEQLEAFQELVSRAP